MSGLFFFKVSHTACSLAATQADTEGLHCAQDANCVQMWQRGGSTFFFFFLPPLFCSLHKTLILYLSIFVNNQMGNTERESESEREHRLTTCSRGTLTKEL